jgi:hypothetical protein
LTGQKLCKNLGILRTIINRKLANIHPVFVQ